jgi:2-polyprenyl-3-methyl-5-hydroxy-6-metoxy-1,4-benzoquinol methylase
MTPKTSLPQAAFDDHDLPTQTTGVELSFRKKHASAQPSAEKEPAAKRRRWRRALWRYSGAETLSRLLARKLYSVSAKPDIEKQSRQLQRLGQEMKASLRQLRQSLRKLEMKQDTLYAELHHMDHGERQVAPRLEMIRPDHVERYRRAVTLAAPSDSVLDLGCGVGYGTFMLAQSVSEGRVLGIDVSPEAIAYAQRHYEHPRIEYRAADGLLVDLPAESFDLAVCFELIEHLPRAPELLHRVHGWLGPGGQLICSTPNEETVPFDPDRFPYHRRHYTRDQFHDLLEGADFTVEEMAFQNRKKDAEFDDSGERYFLVASCRRRS